MSCEYDLLLRYVPLAPSHFSDQLKETALHLWLDPNLWLVYEQVLQCRIEEAA